jgi:magnesium-transporting ATPase (P-type)
MEVESGCVIPVDAVVLKAENLYADESSLTG